MNNSIRISLVALALVAMAAIPLTAAAAERAPAAASAHDDRNGPGTDGWIKAKIVSAFALNPNVSALKLDVKVDNGVAYLGGTAASSTERDLAVEIARGVEGVREVRHEIAIDENAARDTRTAKQKARDAGNAAKEDARDAGRSAGRTAKDASITASVKTKLLANANTPGMQVDVDTHNGVVTLTGTVPTPAQKDLAGRIAQNTENVVEVRNQLTVAQR